ncbi:hypothetical protein MKX03_005853 [Papaver bracteatum]|nr:hypothetical protein MKX03_005853 [Papaver bracteatum]
MVNWQGPVQPILGLPLNLLAGIVPTPSEPIGNPSECLLLKNVFDPASEIEPYFDLDIRDEVQEECSQFGPVKHCYVDNNTFFN